MWVKIKLFVPLLGARSDEIELQRPKTGTDCYTFLGGDTVRSIDAYSSDAKSRGIQFKAGTPLFVQNVKATRGEPLPLETYILQNVLSGATMRSGLVDDENNGKDQNPVSPHVLSKTLAP